jgi:IS1 family transposase
MGKHLDRDKQIQVLRLLSEGNSIRSTSRLTGIHKTTIMRTVVRFGNQCRAYLDATLINLQLRHVQCDEIWTFVGKKQGHLRGREISSDRIGDIYLFTALDTDTKLLATFAIGKRSAQTTAMFIADLEKRLYRTPDTIGDQRPQISTDGWGPYGPTIAASFRNTVRHGVLIKQYVNPDVGRYAPPALVKTDRFNVNGISDLATICTSHVERMNGSIRQFVKRFTRLTYAFSKKLENLAAASALHIAVYNFCRVHSTLKCTPAMAAGIIDTLWSMDDLYNAVTEHARETAAKAKRDRRIQRLIDRLQRNE